MFSDNKKMCFADRETTRFSMSTNHTAFATFDIYINPDKWVHDELYEFKTSMPYADIHVESTYINFAGDTYSDVRLNHPSEIAMFNSPDNFAIRYMVEYNSDEYMRLQKVMDMYNKGFKPTAIFHRLEKNEKDGLIYMIDIHI